MSLEDEVHFLTTIQAMVELCVFLSEFMKLDSPNQLQLHPIQYSLALSTADSQTKEPLLLLGNTASVMGMAQPLLEVLCIFKDMSCTSSVICKL